MRDIGRDVDWRRVFKSVLAGFGSMVGIYLFISFVQFDFMSMPWEVDGIVARFIIGAWPMMGFVFYHYVIDPSPVDFDV